MIFEIKPQHVKGHSYWFWYWENIATNAHLYKTMFTSDFVWYKKLGFIVISPFIFLIFPTVSGFTAGRVTYNDLKRREAKGLLLAVDVYSTQAKIYFSLVGKCVSHEEYIRQVIDGDI